MKWNALVVDDDAEQASTTSELISNRKSGIDGEIECTQIASFDVALKQIAISRFDVLVLDLKDDVTDLENSDTSYGGERILQQLRLSHFTPVVFYTGYAHKIAHLESPFVKVVSKGDAHALRQAVKEIYETKLPSLLRHIQEHQRQYLWDHIENESTQVNLNQVQHEFAFLLARRLSNALAGDTIREFFNPAHDSHHEIAHPIELYIWPPIGNTLTFCDLVQHQSNGNEKFFIVLNPACDFAQDKAEKALLAECFPLSDATEHQEFVGNKLAEKEKALRANLRSLLADRRQGKGIQPDRYKFLPGTSFLPDLVIDFQNLRQISVTEIHGDVHYKRVATLDSPFAESIQSRFVRYYGRVGTPDLEFDSLLNQIVKV
ncbi:hypothetical protein J8I26_12780 [Herbaspirillum sp. LeCh32-8]|uniref:hypothetical protein n=1 Tax=Herbaspirillum sp. LeCh32-8 TaxID=2821356 RepID=UPI001AE681C3|nr:hypothetical protein [Herbaspirillum sp. LeCh32-8]MBP0598989.1 hypothetical protein [Herbaspirillum sp. LeCh32-8]